MAFAALALSACSPQNATPPQLLSRESATDTAAVAVDVQANNGARHLLAAECGLATCKINYTRRPGGAESPVAATLALTTSRFIHEMAVAAQNDGGAVAVWLEAVGSSVGPYRYRYSRITPSGVASVPADLDATGATIGAPGEHRTLGLRSDGTRVVAVFESVRSGAERVYYRQLAPSVSTQGLVFDQASMGGPGRIEHPSIAFVSGGETHMTWRQVRTGVGPGAGSQIGYALGANSASPDVPASNRFVLSDPARSVGPPALAIDIVPNPARIWVAYGTSSSASSRSDLVAARINAGAPGFTRTLDFSARAFSPIPNSRLSIGFNSSGPIVGFLIDDTGDGAVSKDAALWNTQGGAVDRLTNSGIANEIRAATYNGVAALFAYTEQRFASDPSRFVVYDAVHERSIVITRNPLSFAPINHGVFDFAAQGQVAAGAWIERVGTRNTAFDARNNAAPEGRIEITTLADTNTADSAISLREALLISNGGLSAGFSATEQQMLERGGCIFNGSGSIIAGCGRGVTDTLLFTNTITGTVSLITPLPFIDDSAGTRLSAGGRGQPRITIDASALPALDAVLTLTSTHNEISGLHLNGGRRGVWLRGDYNTVEKSAVTSASFAAIDVRSDGNQLIDNALGALSGDMMVSGCPHGRNRVGLNIQGDAANNSVESLWVVCSQEDGVVFSGPGVVNNTALALFVGAAPESSASNLGHGLVLRDGARANRFFLVGLIGNGGNGAMLMDAPDNTLTAGFILSNTGAGALLTGAGATGNTLSRFQIMSHTVGITQRAGALRNEWAHNAFATSAGRQIDIGTIDADDPPGATIRAYSSITRSISGIGATPGATVTVYGLVDVRGAAFSYPLTTTVAAADGSWSAVVPVLVPPDDELIGVLPEEPRRAAAEAFPIVGERPTGAVQCVRVAETSGAGGSELSGVYCNYAQVAPVIMR